MGAARYNFAAKSWIGLRVDFGQIFFRDCDNSGDSSDFDIWSPTSHLGLPCVLGQQQQYYRRHECSFCKNGLDYERTTAPAVPCACTFADFKCAYGFYRSSSSCPSAHDCPTGDCNLDKSTYKDMCDTYVGVGRHLCFGLLANRERTLFARLGQWADQLLLRTLFSWLGQRADLSCCCALVLLAWPTGRP
jgi:hypothetical protein